VGYIWIFVGLYGAGALVFSWVLWGLEFGELCTAYALIPIGAVLLADYALEKLNAYFSKTLSPLRSKIDLSLYMSILNAFMYLSIYTAGASWSYRLTGKYLIIPLLFAYGLFSGYSTLKKFWNR